MCIRDRDNALEQRRTTGGKKKAPPFATRNRRKTDTALSGKKYPDDKDRTAIESALYAVGVKGLLYRDIWDSGSYYVSSLLIRYKRTDP